MKSSSMRQLIFGLGAVLLILAFFLRGLPTDSESEAPDQKAVPVAQKVSAPSVPSGGAETEVSGPVAQGDHFNPEMRKLVRGIEAGQPVRVRVGDSERTYIFRPKRITSDDFKISSGVDTEFPSSFEIFEGRELLDNGQLVQMAKLAVVNDTVSMAYTTDAGDFLIEENDAGELVSRTLLSREKGSTWGHFRCGGESNGRAGISDASGGAPMPPVQSAKIGVEDEGDVPEKAGAQASHPYFRLGAQYDASLKTIRVLMVSGSTQTGSSSNLSSRAASYFTYAATAADVYERQLGLDYQLQELVLIADDSGEPDIEAMPNDPDDDGDDDLLAARNWASTHRPQGTYRWGHLTAWVNVDNAPGGMVGWAWLDSYGSPTLGMSVNERAWTWGVHVHELGHNVGANHTSGGAMNSSVSKSNPKESFFTENNTQGGGFTAAKEIYDYMSDPSPNFVSGPAALRHPEEMPFGEDDAVSTPVDTPITFNPLANDLAATLFGATNNLSLVEVGQVFPKVAGTASVSGNEITFTPVGGYTGNVWFSYTLRGDVGNGGQGWLHAADVVVTVGGNNSDPSQNPAISTTDDTLAADFSGPIRLNPLLNDEGKGRLWAGGVDALSDVDGTAESYSDGAFFLVGYDVITGNGDVSLETVEMTRDGSASTGNTGYLVYTPGGSEPSVVEIAYTVEDADGNQSTGTIYLNNGDSDGDGMLDEWEDSFFGNLDQGATDNPDGDALNNLEEFQADTDPTVADVILFENMEADPGWNTEGQWAFGQPTGQGGSSGNPDPTSGYASNLNVYGYNLNGDYPNNMAEESLTTSTFDCSGYENVTLTFQRWLGVESSSWDHASVRVSNGGSGWVEVWSNSSSMSDSDWTQVTYDISAIADGEAAVQVRWVMGTTDGSVTYCGWNIDEVLVAADLIRPEVSVVATDVFAAEQGQDPGVWTISRDGDLTEPLTVYFSIGGSATPGDDFTVSHSTSVTIPATQSSATVTLIPADDEVFGEIESVEMTLSINSAYTIATPGAVAIAIADNDNTIPEADAGVDQSVVLVVETGGGDPVAGAYWEWDADADTHGDNIWESEVGTTYNWSFDAGNQTPSAVVDPRFDQLSYAYDFPEAEDGSNSSFRNNGHNEPAVFEFVIDVDGNDGSLFESGGSGDGIQVDVVSGVLRGTVQENPPARVEYTLTPEDRERFIHVVFLADSTNDVVQLYVDNDLKQSVGWSQTAWAGQDNASLGHYSGTTPTGGSASQFDGKIALFRYYRNTTFDSNDVETNFNALFSGSQAVVSLDGNVSDDDGTTPATIWSKVSGPGPVTFDDATAVDTEATFNQSGVYVLRLTADDGIGQSHDEITINVITDEDNDGLDDDWETAYFPGQEAVIDGSADSDGDGVLDFFEYLYGSLPNDATSSGFRFEVGPEETGMDLIFEWQVQEGFVLGQDYEVWVSTNLTRWDPLPADHYSLNSVTGNGMTELELTLTVDYGSKVFLRLQQP